MPERSCPACHEPVAPHQTLCPVCRTPVPSEAGPVATDSTAFTFSAPPPRRTRPEPVIRSDGNPSDPITGSGEGPFVTRTDATTTWTPGAVPPPVPAVAPSVPAVAPSAGTLGTPGAAVLDERGNLPGGVAGLVAAALVAVGVFLPWIGVEGRDVSGWSASGDAKVLLALSGVATVVAALLIGGARSLLLRLGLVVLGVVAVGLGLYDLASASGIDGFDVSAGIGLFVVLAGGAVLALAGALTRHRRFLPAPRTAG